MFLRSCVSTLLMLFLIGSSGCQFGSSPRIRLGNYPTSTVATKFLGKDDLGNHGYRFSPSEANGIVYTCKAGHIDIAHLRISADWTAYLATKTFKTLQKSETDFSFRLPIEPSMYFVQITYPDYWQDLPKEKKELIAADISLDMGQYFTFNATTWHEILTWYGFKCVAFFSEYPSAFSWEDSFSNLIGIHIAAKVLTGSEKNFSKAMTQAIEVELEELGIVSREEARSAAEKMRGKWFSGDSFITNIEKRNFDIGLGDGFLTPTIVPDLSQCDSDSPVAYAVPNLDLLSKHGFKIKFEIEPREWEKDRILSIAYPDRSKRKNRIEPLLHYPMIMDKIRKEASARYGPDQEDIEQTLAMEQAESDEATE